MREILQNRLWIAGRLAASNIRAVLDLGVCAVVDLAADEPPLPYPRDIVNCRFPLIDGDGNSRAILRSAIVATTELIKSGVPTVVCCSAGMSRSPAIAAAALAKSENLSLEAALLKVSSNGPHDISTSLWYEIGMVLGELPPPTTATTTSLNLLVLKTTCVEPLLEFYSNLGISFQQEQHGTGPLHHAAECDGLIVEIYPQTGDHAAANKSIRLGFQVLRLEDVIRSLRPLGIDVVKEPRQTPWGYQAVVQDPDGRTVELTQRSA